MRLRLALNAGEAARRARSTHVLVVSCLGAGWKQAGAGARSELQEALAKHSEDRRRAVLTTCGSAQVVASAVKEIGKSCSCARRIIYPESTTLCWREGSLEFVGCVELFATRYSQLSNYEATLQSLLAVSLLRTSAACNELRRRPVAAHAAGAREDGALEGDMTRLSLCRALRCSPSPPASVREQHTVQLPVRRAAGPVRWAAHVLGRRRVRDLD